MDIIVKIALYGKKNGAFIRNFCREHKFSERKDNKMKKAFCIIAVITLLFAGCNNNNPPAETSGTQYDSVGGEGVRRQ